MRKIAVTVLVFLCVVPLCLFAQSTSARLSGTVSDGSGALIPGVTVTATNKGTGIVTTVITNESGTYNFASLQPGAYRASAELVGFQTQTREIELGTSQQARLNFALQVGGVSQSVDVSVAVDTLLATSSSSIGNVLSESRVSDLPLVGRDVLNLTNIMGGVQGNATSTAQTFAGIAADGAGAINVTRDGVSVNDGRWTNGVFATTRINPDLVGEMRVILAPVDAEMGRGSGQVQIQTRSGTNQYRGSAVWNAQNSALDANTWANNRAVPAIIPNWTNRHQYTGSFGGPIVKNKTFFFALWDGQVSRLRQSVVATVLTPAARQGFFRFFPGVNNGNANQTAGGSGATLIAPVVDVLGNPSKPAQAAGDLQTINVFGRDSLRPGFDPTGYMQKILAAMPLPNNFQSGDGLNTAGFQWSQRTVGGGAGTPSTGTAEGYDRKQINIKIDHNFNSRHKLSASWTYESDYQDFYLTTWPDGFSGQSTRTPQIYTVSFTSTLSPTIVNEVRFGLRRNVARFPSPYDNPDTGTQARTWLPVINGIPLYIHPALIADHVISNGSCCNTYGSTSPLWSYGDTLSWTRGKHAFKGGVEVRFGGSRGAQAIGIVPQVNGGAGNFPVTGISTVAGMLGSAASGNRFTAENLMMMLAGSVANVQQYFSMLRPSQTDRFVDFRDAWNNPDIPDLHGKLRDWRQREFAAFFKDDFKLRPSLTLNLGLRWDYYGVPFTGNGLTPSPVGGSSALFGYSGRSFSDWMSFGPQKGDLTAVELVGPHSPNPGRSIYKDDWNNFGPAVGFAWSVPWLGKDKTTVRGGYQVSYQVPGGSFSWVDLDLGAFPGTSYYPTYSGPGTYMDLSNLVMPVPVPVTPLQTVPLTERSQSVSAYDSNYVTPYVQNFTMSVTRSISSNVTLDVRYIGTRGVKLGGSYDLDTPNFRSNGLLDALNVTRAGGDAKLFDDMLKGLNFGGNGVVGTVVNGALITGSAGLRANGGIAANLANGNYAAVASTLNVTNTGAPASVSGVNGKVLRSSGLFPENFIVTNPQFSGITYRTNSNSSSYHSLQSQFTVRPRRGISWEGTYTWSKSLGVMGGGGGTVNPAFTDPTDRHADYSRQGTDRTHDFRSNGTFDLPFGPSKFVLGSRSGVLARVIEGWKASWIWNLTSGAPLSVVAGNTLYANGVPDAVGAFPRNGSVHWDKNSVFGYYFAQPFTTVNDPQCTGVTASQNLRGSCTVNALADANGKIVLQAAAPGRRGTLGQRMLDGPGTWRFDAAMIKAIRVTESKNLQIRLDAQNVLNHPTPGNPNLNLNSGTFGQITTKTGNRTLQAQVRLNF